MLIRGPSVTSPVRAQQHWEVFDGVAGGKYRLVDTLPKWKEVFNKLRIKKYLACDTETNGISYLNSHIVGFCLSCGAEESYYIPIRHTKLIPDDSEPFNPKKPKWVEVRSDEKQLQIEQIFDDLVELFGDPERITIWHNYKFDGHFMRKEGIPIRGIVHDTMLMHNLIDENASSKLKDLAVAHIDPRANKWEKAVDDFRTKFARSHKMPKKNVHYGLVPLNIMTPYGSSDGHYTWAMFKFFQPKIIADRSLRELYVQIESRLVHVLLDMEHNGVVVDRGHLRTISPQMGTQLEELKKVVWDSLGKHVNIESNAQVIPLLQAKGVKFYKKTKGGKPSLDKEVLENLASKYQVAADLHNFRATRKLKTTYVDNLITMSSADEKIHCEYNQNVTTGRMSGKKPNLMNIPRNDPDALVNPAIIRAAFVPPKRVYCLGGDDPNVKPPCGFLMDCVEIPNACPKCGGKLAVDEDFFMLLIDYSQIEVRMTAHYSQDPILLDVYNNTGEDVHLRTCCEMFGYRYKEAEKILQDKKHPQYGEIKKKRQIAKMINFLIIYGGGAKSLAIKISTPQEVFTEGQCKEFIRQYFDRYRGVSRWIASVKVQAQKDLMVQNWFGRYRRLPELKDAFRRRFIPSEKWKIERAYRQGVNYLIQGTCADLFKIALVRVNDSLQGSQSRLVMPIHDELIFYYHRSDLPLLPKVVKDMEDFDFRVPIIAEPSYTTTSWADKKELKLAA